MTLDVSILGFGEVGRALATRLREGESPVRVVSITDRSGTLVDKRGLDVADVLDRKREKGSVGGHASRDARWAVEHVDADVVVDLLPTDLRTGGASPGLALAAFARGKHVVAAGKGALALRGREVRDAAAAARVCYLASASVCGGTPALELLSSAFRGDALERFEGVLNGSTNQILSAIEEGASWDEALSDARSRGILEADPSLDLLGLDAAAKAVILANEAWGLSLTLADAQAQGIVGLTEKEVKQARASGMAVRLVARASPQLGVAVAPALLPRDHPLAVGGKENALRLKLRGAGAITLRGPGAGGPETAAAVLSDLLSPRVTKSTRPILAQ